VRYALLADIHANLHALRAVLAAAVRSGVDAYLCAGDLVGYGAHPNECVDLLAERGTTCVAGNHDLLAIGQLAVDRTGPLARQTLAWTQAELTSETRRYLAALPRTWAGDGVVLTHGSPDDPEEYVTTGERARVLLHQLSGRVLVLGHTHHAWAFGERTGTSLRRQTGTVRLSPAERWLVNPASVGQTRDRSLVARFAVLDLARQEAEFHDVAYDVEACRSALHAAGLPPTYQLRPAAAARTAQFAARARRRLRRAIGPNEPRLPPGGGR
jgi:predicted phosphodiesterase